MAWRLKKSLGKSQEPLISSDYSGVKLYGIWYIEPMNIGQHTQQISNPLDFKNEVSLQELEQGIVNAARLVRRYGSIYWPIVERL